MTVRPSFRVTSSLDVRPTSEDMRRTALTAVMTPCGVNCGHPLTIGGLVREIIYPQQVASLAKPDTRGGDGVGP